MTSIKKIVTLVFLVVSLLAVGILQVNAAVTCDGTHVHSTDFSGLHIPCTGEIWQDSVDSQKKYLKGSWSINDAVRYGNIETNDGRCSEWEWHYSSVPSSYTFYMNWSGSDDFDSGEKHIDLHSTYTSYAAGDMTYLLAYVKTSASIIGTGFISQEHLDPSGYACYDQRACINGAYYNSSGTYVDAPGGWADDWSNGDRTGH